MQKIFVVLLLTVASFAQQHGAYVANMLATLPHETKMKNGGVVDWKPMDKMYETLNRSYDRGIADLNVVALQAQQGGTGITPEGMSELIGLQLKFREILFGLKDDDLIPLQDVLVEAAPESTFAGLLIYNDKREEKNRITSKLHYLDDPAGAGIPMLMGDRGRVELYYPTSLVRWGDIKDKIAFDKSKAKLDDDERMDQIARGAFLEYLGRRNR